MRVADPTSPPRLQDVEMALRTEAAALTQLHVTVTKQLARLEVGVWMGWGEQRERECGG